MDSKKFIAKPNSLSKTERLKSRKLIGQLFKEGKSFTSAPFRILYMASSAEYVLQAGFSVSSRNFKKAVDRNRIKRLMREAYRLQKSSLNTLLQDKQKKVALFFIYTGKELPDHVLVKEKIGAALQLIIKKIDVPAS